MRAHATFTESYNVAVNYGNRNASSNMSTQTLGMAYAGAVASSCTLALGLGHVAKQMRNPLWGRLVPFVAVAR